MTVDDNDDPLVTLSSKQEPALEVLLRGGTQKEAAKAAGVARETVCRWVNDHPGFIAALNQQRRARSVAMRDRVQEMDAKALEILGDALAEGDRAAALAWLRLRSVRDVGAEPTGPMSADEVIDARADARVKEVAQEFRDASEQNFHEAIGLPIPDRLAVRETVTNEMRDRFGLPRVSTPEDEAVHWSDEPCVPLGRLLIAADDAEALTLARAASPGTTVGGDGQVVDVSPLCTWDLALLLDDLRSKVQLPDAPGLQSDDDPFELERVDRQVVTVLANISDADLLKVPPRWATNPDRWSTITVIEAAQIMRTLRDTARSLSPTSRMYLWSTTECTEDVDASPADAA